MIEMLVVTVAVWVCLGQLWYMQMSERARQMGGTFGNQFSLAELLVVLIGVSVQVGVTLNGFLSAQPGWALFLPLPPLGTWGLLEGMRPLVVFRKHKARRRRARKAAASEVDGSCESGTMERRQADL